MSAETIFVGLDVGSTTVKGVVLNEKKEIVFARYTRHLSEVRDCAAAFLDDIKAHFPAAHWHIVMTGSGAIALSAELALPFVQEVIASGICIQKIIPHADVVIELGGEDAKLTFLTGGLDQRMNETCAGGTGAFIDQMASFVGTDTAGLDAMALAHTTIYPIASRCGVFSKTDVLPLLNEGAPREDIAASIMQAVVNQTISGLARGREIKGTAVFLGGPLAFLKSLQNRFKDTLKSVTQAVFPENAHYFVALGAALHARDTLPALNGSSLVPDQVIRRLRQAGASVNSAHLPPLFEDDAARQDFFHRHEVHQNLYRPLETASGNAWLGLDSGSTTIKSVLIDDDGRLLHSFYGPNQGDPLNAAVGILKDIYARKPDDLVIRAATTTGYGSALLTAGLRADMDEVETVAHFTAARFFEPRVSFVLDIGGQDIKCMGIRDSAISHIQLNEACSAGCGSFIENFAASLEIPIDRFVEEALCAEDPVDLGTRCTVFMNSKVKQAQKEGIGVGDIAAGLSYAVVRNACFKVMKLSDVSVLGDHVVAQGGAFANDALLRALENVLGRPVVRPAFPGLMGAFGAALIAKARGPAKGGTQLLGPAEIEAFSCKAATTRCRHCVNSCLLTITRFSDKRRFISGNRCERGAETPSQDLPNLYAFKYRRLFDPYVPLPEEAARRGAIGIPRALNIYENYPLWFTLLSALGFRVELSRPSSKDLFFLGYETIPSQTVCYPAKLAHGHVMDLIQRGIKRIFLPCLPREQKIFTTQVGNYNCPVVIGYPEVLANNINALEENNVYFTHPFLPLDRTVLARRMRDVPLFSGISPDELEKAVQAGFAEMDRFRSDIQKAGEAALETLRQTGKPGIVLAGHPYHVDPGVHHGIAELVTSCGMAVLTEDAVAHLMPDPGPLRVVDQWTYHSRLYRAGAYAAETDNLAVLQLVSFGCGLDAVTADQLEEIVTVRGRLYAQIKIDEGANLGPARIRIRSLLAALRERMEKAPHPVPDITYMPPPVFTEEMRKTHTILIPQMSPIHFQFLETIFATEGYKAVQLPTVDRAAIDLGLRYVNNDACFPAIVVVGQLLQAIHSGAHDPHKIALMISQTGGGCRATNYIGFLRKALHDCGMDHIPIVSFTTNINGVTPGFKPTAKLLHRVIIGTCYGDALMRMLNRVAPYEAEPGSASKLSDKWVERGKQNIVSGSMWRFHLNMLAMIRDFDRLPLFTEKRRPRVGLVGEILLKYHPDINNNAAKVVEQEGGEAVMTDLLDFFLYCFYDHIFSYRHLSGSRRSFKYALLGIFWLEFSRCAMRLGFWRSRRFTPPMAFRKLQKKARSLISLGHQTGEGWLLAAEMVKFLESGVSTILCMQPFGCLPNHITGKGILKAIKHRHPEANIIAVDYDPGASEVNQINRIKLMMSVAK